MNEYIYCFITASPVHTDHGNRYDLPFPIYSQCTCYNNVCYYEQIPDSLIGKSCLVYIAYEKKDEKAVLDYAGYLGESWKVVSKMKEATDKWSVKKEDALATYTASVVRSKGRR